MVWAEQAELYRSDDHWVMQSGEAKLGYEESQTTQGGSRMWLRTNKVPLLDAEGRIRGVLGTYEDISESKRMQERLRESETKYRIVADNTYDWEYWASPNGCFLYTSPSCLRITGYAASEFEADPMLLPRIVHPEDFALFKAHMETDPTGGVSDTLEFRIIHRDGTTKWMGHICQALFDAQGRFLGRRGSNRDITVRKQVEDVLREREELYRELVQNANSAIVRWKSDGTITFFNEFAQEFFGWTAKEIIGKRVSILLPKQDSTGADLSGLAQDIVENPHRYVNSINENVCRDGRCVSMAWTNRAIQDDSGKVIEILAIGSDITDRKQAEKSLRESEAFLNAISRMAKVGGWEVDSKTLEVRWTEETYRIHEVPLSYKPPLEEAIDFFHPEDQEKLKTAIRQALDRGEPYDMELRLITAKGNQLWTRSICKPHIVDGKTVKLSGTFQDITDRKLMEEHLREAHDALEIRVAERTAELQRVNNALTESERELRGIPSRLIAVQEEERKRLARELHDSIGQTLAALKYGVEVILAARDRGDVGEALELLERFVPTLQHSIEETRAIYMGLRPSILDSLGVVATLEWFCRDFQKIYPRQHIEFEAGIKEEEIPEALKIVVFRIAQESLNNIARHSKAEWVDLSLVKRSDAIELSITDDGIGMDLGTISHTNAPSTLGLRSMRERAEHSGGTLSIDSTPGKGTIVRAIWPIWI